MKYLKYFLILLFIPFIVLAEECDISKITITSIEQSKINGNTEEISEPTIKNRNINFNLKMYDVNDSITYDLVIKNDSEENYMIDEDTFKTDSEYIEYTLKTNDNNNVVKANSTKEVSLIVTYKKEVEDDKLTNNKFDASNSLKLSLNTNEKEQPLEVITTDNIKESLAPQEVKNPVTSVTSILLITFILLTAIIIAYVLIKRKNKYTKYIILLLSLLLIPTVYAVCKCNIEVESTIEIEKLPKLFNTVVGLAKEENACVTKYNGEVTDEVGKTVFATKVYFDKCEDNRNVIFGGFCWQVIRTTETEGTKLIYNGEPVDGKCESTRENHAGIAGYAKNSSFDGSYLYGDSFVYDTTNNTFSLTDTFTATLTDTTYEDLIGKYTCKSTGVTCTKIYQINNYESNTKVYYSYYSVSDTNYAQIGTSPFNANSYSPAMVGYMFNKSYNWKTVAVNSGSLMGNDVSYSNGTYTLLPASGESTLGTTKNSTHHYTCNSTSSTCSKVRYYYYNNYYIELDGAENIQAAVNEMLYNDNVNKYNSSAKGIIDAWYAQNLSNKTDVLEDTVYCNARNMINQETNGWNENGEIDSVIRFKNRNSTNDLTCSNVTDQFAVKNDKAKLTYPIALISIEEWNNIGTNSLRNTGNNYWSFSPNYFGTVEAIITYMKGDGSLCTEYPVYGGRGLRPAISLASKAVISSGTGSETDPWIIE